MSGPAGCTTYSALHTAPSSAHPRTGASGPQHAAGASHAGPGSLHQRRGTGCARAPPRRRGTTARAGVSGPDLHRPGRAGCHTAALTSQTLAAAVNARARARVAAAGRQPPTAGAAGGAAAGHVRGRALPRGCQLGGRARRDHRQPAGTARHPLHRQLLPQHVVVPISTHLAGADPSPTPGASNYRPAWAPRAAWRVTPAPGRWGPCCWRCWRRAPALRVRWGLRGAARRAGAAHTRMR